VTMTELLLWLASAMTAGFVAGWAFQLAGPALRIARQRYGAVIVGIVITMILLAAAWLALGIEGVLSDALTTPWWVRR